MAGPNELATDRGESSETHRGRTRRAVLGGLVSGGLAATAGCLNAGDDDTPTNTDGDPSDGDTPTNTDGDPSDGDTPADTPTNTEGADGTETATDSASIGVPFEVTPGDDPATPEQYLDANGVGLDAIEWNRYGQSFTVNGGFGSVEVYATNYGDDESAFEMTVHRGTPGSEELKEIQWEWIQGFEDDSWTGVDVDADKAGTYYVEMSDPVGFSSWNWRTKSPPAVGGTAYLDREPRNDGIFMFRIDE